MPQPERSKYSCACRSARPAALHVTTAAVCATDKSSWKVIKGVHNNPPDIPECCHQFHPQIVVLLSQYAIAVAVAAAAHCRSSMLLAMC